MEPTEPKHSALRALVAATVRVGQGSGVLVRRARSEVVVTAAHVLRDDGPARVWSNGRFFDLNVLHSDADLDLAVLEAPHRLAGAALRVPGERIAVGEDLWATGFPRGWPADDGPVLCRGTVAGIARENWINLDATWGNSGGPLASLASGRPMLVGVTLGQAGDTHQELEDMRRTLKQSQDQLADLERRTSELLRRLEEQKRQDASLAADIAARRKLPKGVRQDAKTLLQRSAAGREEDRHKMDRLKLDVGMETTLYELGQDLVNRIAQHFRTGFVRFAGVDAIRKILGLDP